MFHQLRPSEDIYCLQQARGAGKAFSSVSGQFGYTAMRLSSGIGKLQRTASMTTWKVLHIFGLEGCEMWRNDPSGHECTH